MPIMDGITATKKIKEIDPDTKVIALAAFAVSKGKYVKCWCSRTT